MLRGAGHLHEQVDRHALWVGVEGGELDQQPGAVVRPSPTPTMPAAAHRGGVMQMPDGLEPVGVVTGGDHLAVGLRRGLEFVVVEVEARRSEPSTASATRSTWRSLGPRQVAPIQGALMGKGTHLTVADRDEICDLYAQGLNANEIHQLVGRSYSTVDNVFGSSGGIRPQPRVPRCECPVKWWK